jgi:S-formylglutathione hydrolase FrmB
MRKILAALCGLLLASAPAFAWGGEGHSYVGTLAVRNLKPGPLKTFWTTHETWLATASSYPDRWRNRPDDAEAPRHFLDGEHFGFGADLSRIPRKFGETLKVRTYEQLRTDGIVPWTVARHYKLLVIATRERRWEDMMIQAAYLSHYIGDSHVPFHATENYDGQLSMPSQKGIHSRFETQLLQRSIKLTDLKTGDPLPIGGDPVTFTFTTLQASINEVPKILAFDKEAIGKDGEFKDAYWADFTPKARPIAITRLETAGRALAGLLQAAYDEALKPALPGSYVNADRLLPYAPPFVERGTTAPPTPETVPLWTQEIERARVKTVEVPSKALGKAAKINVLLPADYETSGLRYPVVYLLHGASGAYNDWNDKSGVAAYARTRPFIVVMPDANGDSFYLNTPGRGNVADYLVKELIPFVDKTYRTIAMKEGRAVAGLSMGGYGAWRLALDNVGTFACAASLSGALNFGAGDPSKDAGFTRFVTALYGKPVDSATFNKEMLLPRIEESLKSGGRWVGPALYFDCGDKDFLLNDNRAMEAALLTRGVPYEYAEFKGQHDWPYWDAHIRDVFQFIERHVAAPMK